MPKICSICLEPVLRPAKLALNCQCKYYAHYNCYYRWWIDKKTCIICHKTAYRPIRNNNRTPLRRRTLIRNINIRRTGNNRPQRIYPPETRYIHDFIERLPFDNENEFKTIIFALIIISLVIFLSNLKSVPRIIIKG